jgi:2-methylcitrate dehydratase PrpD
MIEPAMSLPLALALAEWSAALTWDGLPADVQERVRLWLLDSLGLMLAGSTFPPGRAVLEVVRRQGGAPEATLVGGGERIPAAWAALAHGTLAHSLDFDDTLPASVVHPGSLVIPTALAVGEAAGADGAALGAAIAAGYEIAARLGAAAGRAFHARGFHASGVVGPLVAAAVAGKLYGLSPRATAEAMGLAGSMAGGLLEFLQDGSWSKRLHPGWAGHGGVVAAQLAGAGFPGPVSVLEGRHGLYAAFLGSGVADPSRVLDGLGTEWRGREAHAKLYPCAHVIHPFLDVARALREQHGLRAEEIESVVCHVAGWQIPIVGEPREEKVAPRTEYQARASLPFALAAMLVDGRVDLDTFAAMGETIDREDVLALAARITHRERPATGSDAAGFGGGLELTTRTGARLVMEAPASDPPSPDAIRAKFRMTAGRRLPSRLVMSLEESIRALPQATVLAGQLLGQAGAT